MSSMLPMLIFFLALLALSYLEFLQRLLDVVWEQVFRDSVVFRSTFFETGFVTI